jgi:hypothetical protein
MAIGIANYPNITAASAAYPNGQIKDDPSGTPVNVLTNGDLQITFDKILREAGVTPNGLPDNETNGYEIFEALQKVAKRYDSYVARLTATASGAPVVTFLSESDLSAAIVWARTGTGQYTGTLVGAFPATKTQVFPSVTTLNKTGSFARISDDVIGVFISDLSGALDDDFVADIEIRVYR